MPNRLSVALLAAALALASHAALAQQNAAKKAGAQSPAKDQPTAGDADLAHRNKIAMCIGCHGIPGYKTAFPEVYHVPKIAGQQPAYIISALKAYKTGQRAHPSMRGVAASLSDQDMADLAAYYGAPAK
jgi:cytochrome c553